MIKILRATDVKLSADGRSIDCVVTLQDGRVVPFTAHPDDVEAHGRELHSILSANNLSDYAAPIEPE